MMPLSKRIPSTVSSSIPKVLDSSTWITPSLPTVSIALAMTSPISDHTARRRERRSAQFQRHRARPPRSAQVEHPVAIPRRRISSRRGIRSTRRPTPASGADREPLDQPTSVAPAAPSALGHPGSGTSRPASTRATPSRPVATVRERLLQQSEPPDQARTLPPTDRPMRPAEASSVIGLNGSGRRDLNLAHMERERREGGWANGRDRGSAAGNVPGLTARWRMASASRPTLGSRPRGGAVRSESAGPPAREGAQMASEVPPVLAEIILSGPEVVAAERALATVIERSGLSADDISLASEPDVLDLLPAIYVRWEQQVRLLDSSSCGLSVDGCGLLVVSVPLLDIPVVVMALRSRLLDLYVESIGPDGVSFDEQEIEQEIKMIIALIARLEELL